MSNTTRVYLPKLNKEGFGGGNTFVTNFRNNTSLSLQETIDGADVMFVANPMWAERDDFEAAKQKGIRTVLRLDNIPEDWNNRGTAISKLRDFTAWADELIFQSEWARGKYIEFGTKDGTVINNGVDTKVFRPDGSKISFNGDPVILCVKSSRNENKRYPESMEMFRRYYAQNNKAKLILVGQFADDLHKYNFGFYNGENIQYLGIQNVYAMATIYRSCDILFFPAYADAAPNVVLEAMACGCVPIINHYGGGIDFIQRESTEDGPFGLTIGPFFSDYKFMVDVALKQDREKIVEHVNNKFTVEKMVAKYEEVING